LERAFNQNSKPSSEEVYYISESLNMEKVLLTVLKGQQDELVG
jgi:hypothetical protein